VLAGAGGAEAIAAKVPVKMLIAARRWLSALSCRLAFCEMVL
jgi:hypothetical protein